ncbi:MAG: response regulator [Pseudomonadota bacterium]|nr:response regulator [Pseudomonadota bacterium]
MHTVLVVDDEFGVLDILEAVLADSGYRVVLAGNGRQGLELLAAEQPDLVIIDYMMPILDGPATAHAMRNGAIHSQVPIIMMSGAGEPALRRRFTGYQAFLPKPFKIAELVGAVSRVLSAAGHDGSKPA